MLQLSVLDRSPVRQGVTPRQALLADVFGLEKPV
jgi:hypothetical protein